MELGLAIFVSVVPTAINCIGVELSKKMQIALEEQTKNKIKEEGIYHLTNKQAALEIMKSGYIRPSKGKLNNHGAKSFTSNEAGELVYMFAGKPNLLSLAKNMAHSFGDKSDGAFYAVRHFPTDNEIDKYKQRVNDGAITYDGRLQLDKERTEIVKMKLKNGKLVEIPMDEQVKINPVKKRVIRGAAIAGLVASSTKQLLCDTLKFTVMPKNRAKVKKYIQERKLVNRILEQKENEEKELEGNPEKKSNKNSIFTSVKKWAKERMVALSMNKAKSRIQKLEKDEINQSKERIDD